MNTPELLLGQDYERILEAFNAISKLKNAVERRFALIRLASYYRLPKSETRHLYFLWKRESEKGVEL